MDADIHRRNDSQGKASNYQKAVGGPALKVTSTYPLRNPLRAMPIRMVMRTAQAVMPTRGGGLLVHLLDGAGRRGSGSITVAGAPPLAWRRMPGQLGWSPV